MGKGGGRPKISKSPIPSPVPTPVSVDEEVKRKEMDRRRQRIAAAGRGGTILTEQTNKGQATLLGRSTA